MPSAKSWSVISGADSNQVILGVDQSAPQVVLLDAQFSGARLFLTEAYKTFGHIKPLLPDDTIKYAEARIDELTGSQVVHVLAVGCGSNRTCGAASRGC